MGKSTARTRPTRSTPHQKATSPQKTPQKDPPTGSLRHRRQKSRTKRNEIQAKKARLRSKANQPRLHKEFTCITLNINGLTGKKWKALLAHPQTQGAQAIILIEHHLDFESTPKYMSDSGWELQVTRGAQKKDKKGDAAADTRGGVALATRKNTFQISKKVHFEKKTEYQATTWTLKDGDYNTKVHITGVYLSPDSQIPPREISKLLDCINDHFIPPEPPTAHAPHSSNYHIITGDFNAWTGNEDEEHLGEQDTHIPERLGDTAENHKPMREAPNERNTTSSPKTRGRMLLDALKKHELLIMNGRLPLPPPMPEYIYTTNMAGQPSKYVCPPPPDHTPQQTTPYTTRNSTIVDYFLLPKSLFPEVVFCHTPQHSHTSIPHTYPCPSPNNRWKFPSRIDHNLIALQLLLPAHPILGSKNTEAPPPPTPTTPHPPPPPPPILGRKNQKAPPPPQNDLPHMETKATSI